VDDAGLIAVMTKYQCWFCGHGIEEADTGAVVISLQSFWRWKSGSQGDDDPF
jgi:hypothetical protein